MRVNKRQLAEILGVDEDTITEWQKKPDFPPYTSRVGRGGSEYDTVAVLEWWKAGGEPHKERIARLQAEKLQIELDVLRGRAAYIDEIEEVFGPPCDAVRARLLSMSAHLCPKIHGLSLADAIRLTEDYADELLVEFAKLPAATAGDAAAGGGADLSGALSETAAADTIAVGRRVPKAQSRGKRRAGKVAH